MGAASTDFTPYRVYSEVSAGLSRLDVTDVAQPKRPADPARAHSRGGRREYETRVVPAHLLPAGGARQDTPAQPSPAYVQQRCAAAIGPRHLGELILGHAADPAEVFGQRKIGVREHVHDELAGLEGNAVGVVAV